MLRFLIGIVFFLNFTCPAFAGLKISPASHSPIRPNVKWLRKELKKMGLSKGFVSESLKYYEPGSFEKVLTLNLLGFL
ncbi:MAG TPA: hypothetical protein VIG33_03090, partial [Pseudobdellovibrionaceae bacterium]